MNIEDTTTAATTFRRITAQNSGDRVYAVPETGHWAGWADADAVCHHGTLVALRTREGKWLDAEGEPLDRSEISRFCRLKSVGISTR